MGGGIGGFLEGVQGAGADVAVDDAKGSEGSCQWKWAGMARSCGWRGGQGQASQTILPTGLLGRQKARSWRQSATSRSKLLQDCVSPGRCRLWRAIGSHQPGFADDPLGAGGTQAGSF